MGTDRSSNRCPESSGRVGSELILEDGRTLGYAEFGDPSGEPILYFHGHPGSRLEAALFHEPAIRTGARLIGSDRPGMGLSSFQPGRRIVDWPADVGQLADALGLEHFAVAGGSGGGSYAAACAYSIPDRLTGCGLISSAGPPELTRPQGEDRVNRAERRLALHGSPLLRLIFAGWGRWVRSKGKKAGPVAIGAATVGRFPEVDRMALAEPPGPERFGADLLEAFARGSRGPAWDARLLYRQWGFDPREIRAANVHLWHGELDRSVTPETGREIAAAIPGVRARFCPGEGHLSVALNHPDDMFNALLGRT